MKCPNCGFELPQGKHRCLRCGYECKDLTVASDDGQNEEKQREREETIDIDPDKVTISRSSQGGGGGSIFDDLFGGFGFGGGIFGSVLDQMFGGLFDEDDFEDEEPVAYDDFGNRIPIDVFDRDFVEVKEVEIIDRDGKAHRSKNGKINDANVHEQTEEKKTPFDKLRDLRKKRDKKDDKDDGKDR